MVIQNQQSSEEAVYCVIANTLSIPRTIVTADLGYQSILEWDSMGHVSLMLALEKNFGIKIDQDKVLDLISVEDIVAYVFQNKSTKSECVQETKGSHHSITLHRGLNSVYFDESEISYIDAENNKLFYRGYSIIDLVEHTSYEAVVYLLIHGELPDNQQLQAFQEKMAGFRDIPDNILQMIALLANTQSLTSVIRTIVSALSETVRDLSDMDQGIAYIAKIPTIMGAYTAYKNNHKEIIKNTEKMSQAEYLLHMLLGYVPEAEVVRVIEKNMILQAEHESNASAFAARVAKSTEAELGNAITVAISTFSGSLHGGAITGVLQMLEEIPSVDAVKDYIAHRIKNKLPVFGFGHRVYRAEDPRSEPLKKNAEILSAKYGNAEWLVILEAIKLEMHEYIEHGININVDFYACISYLLAGLSRDMLVPVFIAARSAGWVAHILEQSRNNILIRPRLKYAGRILDWPDKI